MGREQRRWLITGADGFIGRHLRSLLRQYGEEVVCAIEPSTVTGKPHPSPNEKYCEADLRSAGAVESLMAAAQPTHIVNLAAIGISPTSSESTCDFVDLNVRLPGHLHALMNPGCTLVQAGSMSQYQGSEKPISEKDGARTDRTLYAWSKNAADSLLESLDSRIETKRSVRARLFGVMGPGEPGHRLIPSIVGNLVGGGIAELSDGTQVRDVLHVEDVVRALFHLATTPPLHGRAVNIGRGEGRSVRWIAERVGRRLDGLERLGFGALPRRKGEPEVLVADVGMLRSSGWTPRFSFEESVDLTVDALLGGETPG
ncbi:MAG: NAD-dependent epimerase/dehydratase [Proteobacteria bacterium]|jgi:nucleoside-diphosphate-sugar epimerase|nr:NAD-dependent epimerase/dehydratase [Pseudomonadota bacterium]